MKFRTALIAAVLSASAHAAPTGADVERAATRVAQTLDGVLRNCPASFARVGTQTKRCVGSGLNVEQVRVKLGAALGSDLYGVWRSRDEQRSVYNWVRTPAGYVYVRLQADPDGRAQTLVYLDMPLESSPSAAPPASTPPAPGAPAAATGRTQIGSVTLTPAPDPRAQLPRPEPVKPDPARPDPTRPEPSPAPVGAGETPGATAPSSSSGAARGDTPVPTASAASLAPVPFRRVLGLQAKRMNGADVAAVQNRLISLMRPTPAGRGDGWYGPVTAATVRAFQKASALAPTGRVDRLTWDTLFSPGATTFAPPPS